VSASIDRGNLDERAAENSVLRLDSKFFRHHRNEYLAGRWFRYRYNMPGLIPGRFGIREKCQALRRPV
jgi:hypothetical protein